MNLVAAMRMHELEFRQVLPRSCFRRVKTSTHTYDEAIQATFWLLGIALEPRDCPDA